MGSPKKARVKNSHLEDEKKDLMALLKELSEELSLVKQENSKLERKLNEIERENQILIEKCLRYTENTHR
jgi:chromosome segregation ATPase